MIKKIIVKNPTSGERREVEVGQLHPRVAECVYLQNKDGDVMNGNLEIKSPAGRKLNLVSENESIQIKPGADSLVNHSLQSLQLDSEMADANLADDAGVCTEFPIKICNGKKTKAKRVIGTKLNTAELVIDTQKAAAEFDPSSFDMKFRCDKWNGGKENEGIGPIYAKMKARAFDLRCYDHGGIAFQIAGADSDGHENKIKFESDRTNENTDLVPVYNGEGGKGVEFGTFNTQHTSLYTKDYRFKGDAKVYGVTRELATEASESGKIDYITQADDFKDILPENSGATWNEIINVARKYADGMISGGTGDGGSASVDPDIWASKSWVGEQGYFRLSDVNSLISPISTKVQNLEGRIFRKTKNGNLEVSAEGLGKYAVENDPSTEIIPTKAVLFTDVNEYNEARGTELTEEEFNALPKEEKIKTPAIEANPASLDLVSDGKIAFKANEISIEGTTLGIPLSINKNGKVKAPGVEETDRIANDLSAEAAVPEVQANIDTVLNAFNFDIALVIENEFGQNDSKYAGNTEVINAVQSAYPDGSKILSVNVFDLLRRVNTLEEKVNELLSANEGSNE